MHRSFDLLREQLLRAGIAPRHVRRYVTELNEHLADLQFSERTDGRDDCIGSAAALLGSDGELAQAMIARMPRRSFAARAPCAVFVMSPALLFVAMIAAIDVTMMHLLWPVRDLFPEQMPLSYRGLLVIVSVVANYLIGLGLMAACIALALRQRVSSLWVWVGLAMVGLCNGAIGFHLNVSSPASTPRNKSFSMVDPVYLHGHVSFAATALLAVVHAVIFFGLAALCYHRLWKRIAPGITAAPSAAKHPSG